MTPEAQKFLLDISQAIDHIDIHLEGKRIFEEYVLNITKRRAVERELGIIGEATNNLIKQFPDIQISFARNIVDLRNRVIHSYDNIDETIIWKVIMIDLPILKTEVDQLLNTPPESY
jgi:uncharacterized protein with HEPN domain